MALQHGRLLTFPATGAPQTTRTHSIEAVAALLRDLSKLSREHPAAFDYIERLTQKALRQRPASLTRGQP